VSRSIRLDDESLLNRAIEEHYEEIKAAVRRAGHTNDSAVDVVHELYVRLAERPDRLRSARSIYAFLARAAINLGIDKQRRVGRESRLFSGTEAEALAVPSEARAPDYALEVAARLKVLRQAIFELPERRRAVFILHRLHQMEPDDIGRRLKISRNMVDRHLRRALLHCLERLSNLD
jgi:RNA polymerase sigma factor (sigma-70 family)